MKIYHISSLNKSLFLSINNLSLNNGFLNYINIFIALYSPFILAALLVIIYLSGKKNESLYAFYVSITGLFINFAIGLFYFHPRPFAVGLGYQLIYHANDSSFPSDHATLAFSIAFSFIIYNKNRLLGIICLIFAFIIGFARVYVGVHFPFDIVGSFIVSLFSAGIIYALRKPLMQVNNFLIGIQMRLAKKIKLS
ncbi:MAG: undecaprenyl-diphosphatase [bacterium]